MKTSSLTCAEFPGGGFPEIKGKHIFLLRVREKIERQRDN